MFLFLLLRAQSFLLLIVVKCKMSNVINEISSTEFETEAKLSPVKKDN